MENLSQIWKNLISGSDFSYLAQISGLSGFKLSKIRDVLVMIVVYNTIYALHDVIPFHITLITNVSDTK